MEVGACFGEGTFVGGWVCEVGTKGRWWSGAPRWRRPASDMRRVPGVLKCHLGAV